MLSNVTIEAISTYLPENRLTNTQLAQEFVDWTAEKIGQKTGVESRAISGKDECASDLGVKASQKLFSEGKYTPEDFDFLLFCTQSPDYFLPTTACLIHEILNLPAHCGALDFNLGCSGYIYGLSLAKGLIATGSATRVLLITAETYSKYIHPNDRGLRTIFGDGASATVVAKSEQSEIGSFVFGTDGSGKNNLIVPAGGHRLPKSAETKNEIIQDGQVRTLENIYMCGAEVFNFTIKTVPKALEEVLKKNNLTKQTADYFVFHQANQYMLEHLRKKCEIPENKFCINMENYGNTVSSTIPMALEKALIDKSIKYSDTVILVGFGVGYSWAGTTVRIGKELVNCIQ